MRVNTRMWSAIVQASPNQQLAANAVAEAAVQAQVHVPIVWRVSVRSSLALSPVPAQVRATLYGAGGTLSDVPVVDGQEFVATGVELRVPPLSVSPGESVYLALAPVSWPSWLEPVTRKMSCGCAS